MLILKIAKVIFWFALVVFIVWYIGIWIQREIDAMRYNATRMGFKQWLDIYTLNPNRWMILRMNSTELKLPIYFIPNEGDYRVTFGFLGNIRYRHWAIKRQMQKESSEVLELNNNLLVKILNNAQLDIDALRFTAQKEIDEAKEIYENVIFRRDWHNKL